MLSSILSILLLFVAIVALLHKKKSAPLSFVLMGLLLARAVLGFIGAFVSFTNGNWLWGIRGILISAIFVLFALFPDKAAQWLGKVFHDNNIPVQIGLAVLTAFIITF